MLPLWLQQLQNEHELILRALDVLEKQTSAPMPLNNKLYESLRLLLDYGDSIHNTKEENHLFPTLVERGMPRQGPIHQMIMDHEAERELLIKWVQMLSEHTSYAQTTFYSCLRQYIESRREHIRTEKDQLYTRATAFLTPSDEDKLLQAFKHIEMKLFGDGVHDHYEKLLREMELETPHVSRHQLLSLEIQAILEHLKQEALLLDPEGTILYANRKNPALYPGLSLGHYFPRSISDAILKRISDMGKGNLIRPLAYTRNGIRYLLQFLPLLSQEKGVMGVLLLIEEFVNLENAEHLT
ncbi:hemerythrin domain-containing protein [candidate division KSB1 bacterium]|nr:hemerythrin domain-containing protein [candidate division KSB1 bacterium]